MPESFQISIEPFVFYNKHVSQNHVLCGVGSDCIGDENYSFRSECSNKCMSEIMSETDDYLDGKSEKDTELFYKVACIFGGENCPFSFWINVAKTQKSIIKTKTTERSVNYVLLQRAYQKL